MQQGNITSINWANSSFMGYIQNEIIYNYNGQQVGVTIAKYQEIEEALKKCKDKLIELGVIKIPKTPEEIIKEQSEMLEKQGNALNQMLATCQQLQEQLEGIKDEHTTITRDIKLPTANDEKQCEECIRQSSTNDRPDNGENGKRPKSSSTKIRNT